MSIRAFVVSKPKSASVIFALVFFAVTESIFPWRLHSMNSFEFASVPYEIFSKDPITSVTDQAIYKQAVKAFVPFLMVSPWALWSKLKCAELACLIYVFFQLGGLVLIFALYCIAFYALLKRFLAKKVVSAFLILGLIWLGFSFYGILYVKRNFVDKVAAWNVLFKRLEQISGAAPFPQGTKISFGTLSDKPIFVDARAQSFSFEYKNPATRSKQYSEVFGEQYSAEMLFYDARQPYSGEEACKRMRGILLIELAEGVFECEREIRSFPVLRHPSVGGPRLERKVLGKRLVYGGYIDSGRSIFVAALPYFEEYRNNFPGNKFMPTFFLHYFKHKDSL